MESPDADPVLVYIPYSAQDLGLLQRQTRQSNKLIWTLDGNCHWPDVAVIKDREHYCNIRVHRVIITACMLVCHCAISTHTSQWLCLLGYSKTEAGGSQILVLKFCIIVCNAVQCTVMFPDRGVCDRFVNANIVCTRSHYYVVWATNWNFKLPTSI
jgi:hypothetical protein